MCDPIVYVLSVQLCYSNCYYTKSVLPIMLNKIQFNSKDTGVAATIGTNGAIVDLRRAYLQIRVHESLWSYQTVIFRGQRSCLTRLWFGLNAVPSVMKYVLTAVLTQDETVDRATSSYLDDIFVKEDVVSVQCVENRLLNVGQRNVWLVKLEWTMDHSGQAERHGLSVGFRTFSVI